MKFAKDCGVSIVESSQDFQTFGGKFAYRTKDSPGITMHGHRTVNSAYRGWLINKFGHHGSRGIMKLLKKLSDYEEYKTFGERF